VKLYCSAYFVADYAPAPAELLLVDTAGGLVRQDRDLAGPL
jgi:hypothetical protein